jgi:hypothetical protein
MRVKEVLRTNIQPDFLEKMFTLMKKSTRRWSIRLGDDYINK